MLVTLREECAFCDFCTYTYNRGCRSITFVAWFLLFWFAIHARIRSGVRCRPTVDACCCVVAHLFAILCTCLSRCICRISRVHPMRAWNDIVTILRNSRVDAQRQQAIAIVCNSFVVTGIQDRKREGRKERKNIKEIFIGQKKRNLHQTHG